MKWKSPGCLILCLLNGEGLSESKINQNDGGGEHEADYPGVDLAEDVDGLGVFVVVQAESLEGRGEGVTHVNEHNYEEDEVHDGDVAVAELFANHVVEVGFGVALGQDVAEQLTVVVGEMAYPLTVVGEVAFFVGFLHEVHDSKFVAEVGNVAFRLGSVVVLLGVLGSGGFDLVDEVFRGHVHLVGHLNHLHHFFVLEFFYFNHVLAFDPAEFGKIEVGEVDYETYEDKYACPHHEFGAGMGFALARLMVAHGTGKAVGDPKPSGKEDVEGDEAEENHFEDFDNVVGAHEMAKRTVPSTVVVTQDKEVGTGVEQKEDEQEPA